MERKEVREMISDSEERIERNLFQSHSAIASTISGLGSDFKQAQKDNNKELKDMAIKMQMLLDKHELIDVLDSRTTRLEWWRSSLVGAWSVVTIVFIPIAFIVISQYI